MKVTVWTLASDDDNGTGAQVFLTEREATVSKFDSLFYDDKENQDKAIALWDAEKWTELDELIDEHRDPLDTYSIDSHTLEVEPDAATTSAVLAELGRQTVSSEPEPGDFATRGLTHD